MKTMWSNKYVSVIPNEFKRAVGNFAPQFNGYSQHDAQELMAFLLDGLHEDTNKQGKAAPKKEPAPTTADPTVAVAPGDATQQMVVDENPSKKKEETKAPEPTTKEEKKEELELPSDLAAWKAHQSRNESFVVDLFHGQLKSKLACDICLSVTNFKILLSFFL
jgi:ubiquitin C-terminal hydrolase